MQSKYAMFLKQQRMIGFLSLWKIQAFYAQF